MYVRAPDIEPDQGKLIWSKLPEFSVAYNGYSVVIPYVEYYLNSIMNKVKAEHCADNPKLREELEIFVKQETNHSKYHVRFNKRMYDANVEGLKPLIERVVSDLRGQREKRSLAFNLAYCAGFESIATYDSQYLYLKCDEYFEGADAPGANLLLWHVAEEFEHRSVCHDAFLQVSGNYFIRIWGLVYAFIHIGAAFLEAEDLVLKHYTKDMSEADRRASYRRSKALFWRQLRYVAPRMLKIFLPGYNPSKLATPGRIGAALTFFKSENPIRTRANVPMAQAA